MPEVISKQIEIIIRARDETRGLFGKISESLDDVEKKASALGGRTESLSGSLGGLSAGAFDSASVQNYSQGIEQVRATLEQLDIQTGILQEDAAAQWSLMRESIEGAGMALAAVGNTFSSGFAQYIVEGSWDAERALRSLAKTIATTMIDSLIQWAVKQVVIKALQSAQIFLMGIEQRQVAALTVSYYALAAAKMAALGPAGLILHAGGIVMHSGGEIRRAHSGLRPDEAGPFILQRGEFVLNRSAVRSLGVENLVYMNETGQAPNAGDLHIENITINAGSGDGRRLAKEFMDELRWEMKTGGFCIPRRAIERR